MKAHDIVKKILQDKSHQPKGRGEAFAPVNIALCKYWGKRDEELKLPVNSSLSISLKDKGTTTSIAVIDDHQDCIFLNGEKISDQTSFSQRITHFLDLFRDDDERFLVRTENQIPVSAGLASSASGFAALVKALNQLFHWHLDERNLSILARLGSGSACRSLWNGFVQWHQGEQPDGMDSFAERLPYQWSDLRIGLLIISNEEKMMGSSAAMRQTVETSSLYACWPHKVRNDLGMLEQAIIEQNFQKFGMIVESNALAMHATMLTAWPPILYAQEKTIRLMHKIWELRGKGILVFFTQDAGPNLKLLYLKPEELLIKQYFPEIEQICPFD